MLLNMLLKSQAVFQEQVIVTPAFGRENTFHGCWLSLRGSRAAAGHSSQSLCSGCPSSPQKFRLQPSLLGSKKQELWLERGLAQHFPRFILYQEHRTNKNRLSIRCFLRCRTYCLGNSCGTLPGWKCSPWKWGGNPPHHQDCSYGACSLPPFQVLQGIRA